MKKIIMAAMFALFSMAAFAGVSKEKATAKMINKKEAKVKTIECYAYETKVEQYAKCSGPSYYTVKHVDTISVTCDANGIPHSEIWPWDQDPSLICQPMRKTL